MIEEHSVIKLHTTDLSDNNKIQFKKWSNIKRYKGMDNYKFTAYYFKSVAQVR